MEDSFCHHIKCYKDVNLSLKYCAVFPWRHLNVIRSEMDSDVETSLFFAKGNFWVLAITTDCTTSIDNFDRTDSLEKHFYCVQRASSRGKLLHQTQLICFNIILIHSTLFLTRKHKILDSIVRSSSNFISKQRSMYLNFCTIHSKLRIFILAKLPHKERHIVI